MRSLLQIKKQDGSTNGEEEEQLIINLQNTRLNFIPLKNKWIYLEFNFSIINRILLYLF